MEVNAARRVMFSSYLHLPVVLLALLFDKIPSGGTDQLGNALKIIQSIC